MFGSKTRAKLREAEKEIERLSLSNRTLRAQIEVNNGTDALMKTEAALYRQLRAEGRLEGGGVFREPRPMRYNTYRVSLPVGVEVRYHDEVSMETVQTADSSVRRLRVDLVFTVNPLYASSPEALADKVQAEMRPRLIEAIEGDMGKPS
jgi:hypothetical protein